MLRSSSLIAIAFASGGTIVPIVASAHELGYRAPEGCPSLEDVRARINADSSGGRPARIDIRTSKNGYRGEVLVGEGELSIARVIEARTCGAVVEALVLVIALDHEENPADESATAAASSTLIPRVRVAAPSADSRPEAVKLDQAVEIKPRSRLVYTLIASARLTSFADGKVLFGGELGAETMATHVPLHPSVRASFLFVRALGWTAKDRVEPEFDVVGGAFDGCVGSPFDTDRFRLAECSHTEIGSLTASAAGVDASAESRFWLTTGAALRARLVPATSGSTRIMIEANAGLLAALIRDRFHFIGYDPIVAAPWLWSSGLGLGVVFR